MLVVGGWKQFGLLSYPLFVRETWVGLVIVIGDQYPCKELP